MGILLIIIGIVIFLFAIFSLYPYFWMDPYYHVVYSLNKEEGNNTINNLVSQTQNYDKSPVRLVKIASLITQNFSDSWWPYQWEERFCTYENSSSPYGWCSPYYGTPLYTKYNEKIGYPYLVTKLGNVTAYVTNDLSVSPEWIAYQKGGNCQAISILFNETVNRSGFVSRVVRSKGYNHVWNEIEINGSWKVFDIQQFGYSNGSDIADSQYWNVDPKEYSKFLGQKNISIHTFNFTDVGFGEDISPLYFPES